MPVENKERMPPPRRVYTLGREMVDRSKQFRALIRERVMQLEEKSKMAHRSWSTWTMEPAAAASAVAFSAPTPIAEGVPQKPQTFMDLFLPMSQSIVQTLDQAVEWEDSQRKLVSGLDDDPSEPEVKQSAGPEDCDGMWYYRKFPDVFRHYSMNRSFDQKRFHDAARPLFAPLICGDDWPRCMHTILNEAKYVRIPCIALALTPRRWGKSIGMGMLCATLLYMCRGIKVLLFAQTVRMAQKLLNIIRKFYMELPGAESRVVVRNAKEFHVRRPDINPQTKTAMVNASDFVNQVEACSSDEHSMFLSSPSLVCFCRFFVLVHNATYIHTMGGGGQSGSCREEGTSWGLGQILVIRELVCVCV